MDQINKTPMMQQYLSIKKRYPNEILFFRMGDFYEMFLEDAVYASRVLDIALTKRGDQIPMCGIPHHAWQNYVVKILKSGKNIAICEQMEDPKNVKNRIVQRDVIRVLTPGSIFEEELLDKSSHSLLGSLFPCDEDSVSLTATDLSTGELWLDVVKKEELQGVLNSRDINEVVLNQHTQKMISFDSKTKIKTEIREYRISTGLCEEKLKKSFDVAQLGILELAPFEVSNLYRLFSYIEEVAPQLKPKWQHPKHFYSSGNMLLDEIALQTLEIIKDQSGEENASLLAVLDQTKTRGGKRRLREILMAPSFHQKEIEDRYDLIDFLIHEKKMLAKINESLKNIKDAPRILNHLRHSPKVSHLGSISQTLQAFYSLRSVFEGYPKDHLPRLILEWAHSDFPVRVLGHLHNTLVQNELPPLLDERRFVQEGFSKELDELFQLSVSAHQLISAFEKREQKKWGINTLKVRYNRVIGYYIEISKGGVHLVPEHYIRRQTLMNGERFTLPELSDLADKILNAKDNIIEKQKKIFDELVQHILQESEHILNWAEKASFLDCMVSFAETAVQNKYVRPLLRNDGAINLQESRHPVVEMLFKEEVFVPNDVQFDQNKRHLAILTGPNMSGKSTYIRQIGLIQIMAQAGSFVPASYGELPLVDRIFTRIGAYDRLSKGESTFFVEMSECAKIFEHYTKHSLILLDEVGRGTSTFDGMSIARAMLEFLNEDIGRRSKIIFATHFTELSELISTEKGIFGLRVDVVEENGRITFLRKIREGVTSESYGVHVAELAGVPPRVVTRAREVMLNLERKNLWAGEIESGEMNHQVKEPLESVKTNENQQEKYRAKVNHSSRRPVAQNQPAMF